VYLRDALDSARAARDYLKGVSREQFLELREKQDAVMRALEVLGEAAGRLSQEGRDALPDVRWRRLVGMRNILIHRYDNVDLDIVYDTVMDNLPKLIERLEAFLDQQDSP